MNATIQQELDEQTPILGENSYVGETITLSHRLGQVSMLTAGCSHTKAI